MELARDEPVRHERVHRLVQGGRHRAAAGLQPRHRHAGAGRRLRRVLQRGEGHEVERAAARARLRAAPRREDLVPGQRDGRPVADGPHDGARVRKEGARRGAADPRARPQAGADRLRLEQHDHAHVPRLGPRGARGVLRPGRRDLAAQLLRQYTRAHRQGQLPLPGDEPGHGAPDPGDRGRLRLRAGGQALAEAAVAVLRRVERLVPRARRPLRERPGRLRAAPAGGGVQPGGRAPRRRVRKLAAAPGRAGPRRLPGPDPERDRAARDERDLGAAPVDLLPVRVGAPVREGQGPRPARRVRDVPDQGRGLAARLRARRAGAVPRRRGHARPENGRGVPADAEPRPRVRARDSARVARRDALARARLRDADRARTSRRPTRSRSRSSWRRARSSRRGRARA